MTIQTVNVPIRGISYRMYYRKRIISYHVYGCYVTCRVIEDINLEDLFKEEMKE